MSSIHQMELGPQLRHQAWPSLGSRVPGSEGSTLTSLGRGFLWAGLHVGNLHEVTAKPMAPSGPHFVVEGLGATRCVC
jgi:hypothetical protein